MADQHMHLKQLGGRQRRDHASVHRLVAIGVGRREHRQQHLLVLLLTLMLLLLLLLLVRLAGKLRRSES
jgi:hypothetical protein